MYAGFCMIISQTTYASDKLLAESKMIDPSRRTSNCALDKMASSGIVLHLTKRLSLFTSDFSRIRSVTSEWLQHNQTKVPVWCAQGYDIAKAATAPRNALEKPLSM